VREMGQSTWLSTSPYNLQGLEGRSQCEADSNGSMSRVRTCGSTEGHSCRMLKKFFQRGRRRVEAGGVPSGVR